MARVSKPPQERRDELLDHATVLCATQGYESLSIDQLTRNAGVAKGTFYYHFPTKQDMLIALVNRFIEDLFADLEQTALTLTGTGAERFRQLLLEATAWKTARMNDAATFIPLLYRRENLELRHRLFESSTERSAELFLPSIEAGARDGSLRLPPGADPQITTGLVMTLWLQGSTTFFDRALVAESAPEFAEILTRGIASLNAAVEAILGATPGTFTVSVDPAAVEATYEPFVASLNIDNTTRSTR